MTLPPAAADWRALALALAAVLPQVRSAALQAQAPLQEQQAWYQ
ncbi:hypothetical protein [Xanthomonas hortorum]